MSLPDLSPFLQDLLKKTLVLLLFPSHLPRICSASESNEQASYHQLDELSSPIVRVAAQRQRHEEYFPRNGDEGEEAEADDGESLENMAQASVGDGKRTDASNYICLYVCL